MAAEGLEAHLNASEHHVGLPRGQMGNSEVGHMNLGAGRVVLQDLPRIDAAIADGSLAYNPKLMSFQNALLDSRGAAHLIGLMSPGGVHSHQQQIAAIAKMMATAGVPVYVHALLDGRDTPPSSAAQYLVDFTEASGGIQVATICGRYFAMDRDNRWDRVMRAYEMLVDSQGKRATNAVDAIISSYEAGATDEFVEPTVIGNYTGMRDGDGILMVNFRADRARELLTALLDPHFDGFDRKRTVKFASTLGMIEYSDALNPLIKPLFPSIVLKNVFGEILAQSGRKQLRIAETEKYAHVTFFFNGGREQKFVGEERILVTSPDVATYDMKPEMSAPEVTDKVIAAIRSGTFDFILVNYANTDMVGHTGDFDAAVQAVQTVDSCLGRLREAVTDNGGTMLVTADHGNAEMMTDLTLGIPHTAHTKNLVPALLIGASQGVSALKDGCLADVAPTMLALMGIPKPKEMSGQSLLIEEDQKRVFV
jgi:2,3-bisphosphoglycerate-independent phosphoglycerate mutase